MLLILRVDLLVHIQLQLFNAYHSISMGLWVHPTNFDIGIGSLRQSGQEPWHAPIVTTTRSGIATLPIPQGVAGVPFVRWVGMRCCFTVVVVANKQWRLSTPYITRTVGSATTSCSISGSKGPYVVALTSNSTSDRQSTHVGLFNGCVGPRTVVEGIGSVLGIPESSSTNIVIVKTESSKLNSGKLSS